MSTDAAPTLDLDHGPVELLVVSLPSAVPDPALMGALADLVQAGTIALADLVVVAKDADGDLVITEYEDLDVGLPPLDLILSGLLSDEDVADLAETLPPDSAAALVVIEHLWSRALASRLLEAGGEVIATDRIPAPVVNELIAIIKDDDQQAS